MGLPLSLENVGAVLGLEKQKLTEGKDLIRYFCKPCAATTSNGRRTRNLPEHAPDKWEQFKSYNSRDVETEISIQARLAKFPVPDNIWEEYHQDQEINDRGVLLDMTLVKNAIAADERSKSELIHKMRQLTNLDISSNQSGTDASVSEVELLEGVPYGFDYYNSGNRVIGPIALSGTAYGDEVLQWTLGDMPVGTSVTISCALTNDETPPSSYTAATNGTQCPVIAENNDMNGKYLWIKQELATSDIEVTPSLLTMEIQLVLAASANLTIEIDRTTLFSGMNYRSNTVSALPCGEITVFEPYDVYDGFLYWRARAINEVLGIDTGWSTPNTFNLMGGPFPLPRFFTLLENRQYGKLRDKRTLFIEENIGFGKPRERRTLYVPENRAFGKLRATRTIYTELNVTDDPPFPWISSISVTRGQAGSVLTLNGSGFGYTHTVADLGNTNRYLRSYLGDDYYPAIINPATFEAAETERIRRAEKLGRIFEPKENVEVVYPNTFRVNEGVERFDDPFQQAEYAYSLIESEVQM